MAKKDQQLTVRVSKEEKREIERRAAASGLSVSRFMAEAALSDEEGTMSEEEREALLQELGDLFEELRSIGGHTNQIAYRLNSQKTVTAAQIDRAAEAVEQVSDSAAEAIEKLK
jgi:Protein of unknown function (DUF1778).